MDFLNNIFTDYTAFTLISLSALSFLAGFIDAVIGGGGLIQLPALLINFPQTPIASIFGTNKIAALAGTSISAIEYSKKIKFNYKLLLIIATFAGIFSYIGAKTVSYIDVNLLKPIILIILILIAIYTFAKKDFGTVASNSLPFQKQAFFGLCIGIVVGFYDGFFGPGTGSFFVLFFVLFLKFEFLQASAYAKVINCVTNLGALFIFVKNGNYILEIALVMALCNILGNIVGTKTALKKGNQFVRNIFQVTVLLMICRYSYDIFIK